MWLSVGLRAKISTSVGVSLTLNMPGFLDDLEAGGVRKYVTFVFVVLDCNF